MEIHLYNPWLTYGIGLHRLREAGLLPEIFGDLDERPLNLDQLHEFCKIFLIGDDRCIDLPHPRKSSWNDFFGTLKVLIDKEKTQWNPVKKKVMPWIDLDKLQSIHGGRKIFGRRHTTTSFQRSSSQNHYSRRQSMEPLGCHEQPTQRSQDYCRDNRDSLINSKTECISVADLQNFIFTAPLKFPPNNTMVEPHKYFEKWKVFDSEAFVGVNGDELTELLLRGMLFLWPDLK
jgi:hypothetical protein